MALKLCENPVQALSKADFAGCNFLAKWEAADLAWSSARHFFRCVSDLYAALPREVQGAVSFEKAEALEGPLAAAAANGYLREVEDIGVEYRHLAQKKFTSLLKQWEAYEGGKNG